MGVTDVAYVVRDRPVLSLTYAGVLLSNGELDGVEDHLRNAEGWLNELLANRTWWDLSVLAGYYRAHDERLARSPGGLSGVIGAAPGPLDV